MSFAELMHRLAPLIMSCRAAATMPAAIGRARVIGRPITSSSAPFAHRDRRRGDARLIVRRAARQPDARRHQHEIAARSAAHRALPTAEQTTPSRPHSPARAASRNGAASLGPVDPDFDAVACASRLVSTVTAIEQRGGRIQRVAQRRRAPPSASRARPSACTLSIHTPSAAAAARLRDRVRNVVELEIEEYVKPRATSPSTSRVRRR